MADVFEIELHEDESQHDSDDDIIEVDDVSLNKLTRFNYSRSQSLYENFREYNQEYNQQVCDSSFILLHHMFSICPSFLSVVLFYSSQGRKVW
ncbi:unnamed protein product [Hermetia illucens]|uniref:Uncharacterized protein n=1 Tax=Hermetia illucens TaxID=343691 RepID=A0A7R8YSE7_HERIL|nr:unnamed protein product [Hermetia illucens]